MKLLNIGFGNFVFAFGLLKILTSSLSLSERSISNFNVFSFFVIFFFEWIASL